MAVSKNTIVITSKGPKGEAGAAVTVDGAAITSFSTVAVTSSDNVVADAANDTFTLTGGDNVTLTTVGSEITIDSPDTNTTYDLASAQNASNVEVTLTGSDATTDTITLVAGSNVTLTDDGSNNVTIASTGGGGGGSVTVYDDGSALTSALSSLNFTGSGVTLTEVSADNITVDIPNGANSFGTVQVGAVNLVADSYGDTLTVNTTAGSAVALTGTSFTDTLTINAYIQNETDPTLGAGLDVKTYPIYTTTTNGNVVVYGDGTGVVSLGSTTVNNNVNCSPGLIAVRNNGTQSEIRLYEESDVNYVSLKAPTNASLSADLTFTLPSSYGTSSQFLQTDGAGGLTWASGGSATSLSGQKLEYIVSSTALASAGDYEGLVLKVGDAGNTLTAGTVYYFDAVQTDWVAASNAAEGTAKGILGIALGTSGTADGVLIQGVYYYADAAGVTGDVLFLGTAGAMTATAPTTDGEILRVLGQNIDDNIVMFQPSQDFVELGAAAGTTGLDDLSDVTVTTPAAGQVLIYDSVASVFENATLTEGGSVVITEGDGSITIDACQGQELNVTTRDSVDGAVSAAGEAEGIIVNFGNDATTQGSVYTYASGTWTAVNASASGEATTKGLLGLALGTNSTTDGMLIQGVGYITHQNNATAAGEVLYIDTAAGEVSTTQPSASTQYVRVVGYALAAGGVSGSKIFFSPSQDWIEIA